MAPLAPAVASFLDDADRSVRLSATKLIVALARADPATVGPVASSLADEEEFYFVRARSAEALGYAASEQPDDVASPDVLADLSVGLSFDEPEVREKLAKALAFVALGDPGRLRHHVETLAEHVDDGATLVRYHLLTALVVVGSVHPAALEDERS